jgi:heme-degrading monooxygenase HmoA
MFVIVWEFRVVRDRAAEFERVYGADGDWARLFRRGEGFLSTELLRDRDDLSRFVTIDRWRSRDDYDAFRAAFDAEYIAMDATSELLTDSEKRVGIFEMGG